MTVEEDDIVLYEKEGSTARLILNRPEKGNAMPLDGLDRRWRSTGPCWTGRRLNRRGAVDAGR